MIRLWHLLLFVRPIAFNHPYTHPVMESYSYATYAACSAGGRERLGKDDAFEEYACVRGDAVEMAEARP